MRKQLRRVSGAEGEESTAFPSISTKQLRRVSGAEDALFNEEERAGQAKQLRRVSGAEVNKLENEDYTD